MKRIFLNYYLFVILILLLAQFVAIPLIERLASAPFRQSFISYYQDLTRGSFHVVSEHLRQFPEQQWHQRLQALQPQFGYPISLVELSPNRFSRQDFELLQTGAIVVAAGYDTFWRRIDQSGQVLAMGPFPSPGIGNAVTLVVWGIILVLLGVAVMLWILPFWRTLTRISTTATTFGEGNLDVRAQIPRQSSLAPLATAFNQMADRIQHLITSHRELTNAVSHELRTPIARLRFGWEMVFSSEEPDRTRYARGVQRDLDVIDNLVKELLTYARFENKMVHPRSKMQCIAAWLREETGRLAQEIPARLESAFAIADDLPVFFDDRLLQRALNNLVHNASKYGNGLVRVGLEQHGQSILIHVDDNGPGIPAADRERVFEPFSRLDTSRSRESGGYGLGLAIVRQVTAAHGGSISVTDSELGGSRFTICLPG